MLCHRVYCILICSHHTHCSRIDNENIIIKKGSKGTSSVLEGVIWWPICPRFLLVCVTKYRMMERKIMSKNKIIWTYCTLNRHKNQAGWLRCLLHLRKGSVSTLLSRRAAGQTERGFPTHTQSLRTLIGSDWKPDRQTDRPTKRHFAHSHSLPTTISSITQNTLPLSVQGLVPSIPNTTPPTLTDKPPILPTEWSKEAFFAFSVIMMIDFNQNLRVY